MNLVIAHPAATGGIRGGKWLYADSDIDVFLRLRTEHGEDRLWLEPAGFQQRARELVGDYIAWCDRQILRAGGEDEWILSAYHRHPYESDQFVYLTWLKLLAERYAGEALTVVTAHRGFAHALEDLARDRGWKIDLAARGAWLATAAAAWSKGLASLARDMAHWLARIALSPAARDPGGASVYLAGYFHEDSIGEDGSFNDRYFRRLARWYEERGVALAHLPLFEQIPLRGLRALYASIGKSRMPVLLAEQFVGWGDVLASTARCLARACTPAPPPERFLELDVTRILEGGDARAALWGLTPLLLKKRAQRVPVAPSATVVEWFENQRIGRASALGWRGRARHVALRQYVPGMLFTNLFCSSAQLRASACPGEEWVCGEESAKRFAIHAPELKVRVVPAIRYQYLYEAAPPAAEGSELLVALSHSLQESKAILGCLLDALAGASARFSAVRIKPHPDQNLQGLQHWWSSLQRARGRSLDVQWEKESLVTCLPRARIVMTTGSGAGLEALCSGIPVIVVGPGAGLDITILDAVDRRLWTEVYDARELRAALAAWSPYHPVPFAERLASGAAILAHHFEPGDPERMQGYLP